MQNSGAASKRRTFVKSLNGCRKCRERKVKCDEVHPICGKCARHFKNPQPCEWGSGLPPVRSSSTSIQPRNNSLPHPCSPSVTPELPNPIGMTKLSFSLRMFYHYIREVAPSFPQAHNPNIREMWMVDVPQLSFECDYLLNGILSVAALHLYLTRCPDDAALLKESRVYFDLCIKAFQNVIDHLDESNAERAFLTGIILVLLAQPLSRPTNLLEAYQPPMCAMHLTKALETLREKTGKWLAKSNVGTFLTGYVPKANDLPRKQFLYEEEKADLQGLLIGLDLGSPEADIYRESIEHVKRLQDAAVAGETEPAFQRKFILFAFLMSPGFMSLLDQHDPRALVILAHHMCMAKFCEGWYIQGMAEYDVPGIHSILPDAWKDMCQWPLYIIGKEGKPTHIQSMPMFAITEFGDSG